MYSQLKNIIERFPATLIIEPTAFTSNSPMDMYNNVLVFIVGGGSGTRSEMHIFQVCNIFHKTLMKCIERISIMPCLILIPL